MNTLYGLLTSSLDNPSGYYVKLHTPVTHTTRSQRLRDMFVAHVPDDRLCLFACAVCHMSLGTVFGREIAALDPENTYAMPVRDPSASAEDPSLCMYDLTLGPDAMKSLMSLVDQDIRERLVAPSWPEYAAAICLQLLREAA